MVSPGLRLTARKNLSPRAASSAPTSPTGHTRPNLARCCQRHHHCRAGLREGSLHRGLRRLPRHRDVLGDHWLDSGARVVVRHAHPNRALTPDRSTTPLSGYELTVLFPEHCDQCDQCPRISTFSNDFG
jgi:hypothetical protein